MMYVRCAMSPLNVYKKKTNRNMFELKKVLLTKYGGLEISYVKDDGTETSGEPENPVEYKIKSIAMPHPDLRSIITCMGAIVAETFMMMPDLVDDRLVLERIKVKGVEFASGNSVMIHFEWIAKNELSTKIVTPRIKLDSEIFGFEKYLADMVEMLRKETFEYINGKRAQLSLFGADGEPGASCSEDVYNEAIIELENE